MSDLLNSASLVMIPSGYKEDVVYSQIPTDGSGDLSFTRASNGTRINSAGLVEVCPWNLVGYSEDFSNAYWTKNRSSITANSTTAPNGTTTADTLIENTASGTHEFITVLAVDLQTYSFSIYAKANTRSKIQLVLAGTPWATGGNGEVSFDLSTGAVISAVNGASGIIQSVGNSWYRCTITKITSVADPSGVLAVRLLDASGNSSYTGNGTSSAYFWGAQLNIGSTAKPYFPTTDRLNVPRLTYQNGGGGCPSLLLEKQSTNLVSYSNGDSSFAFRGTFTANATTSPEGVSNAFSFLVNSGQSGGLAFLTATTSAQSYTFSAYLKGSVNGQKVELRGDLNGTIETFTLTTDWVRYTKTFTGSVGAQTIYLLNGAYLSPADYNLYYGYGLQLEASSYATSLIPSTSSSATRVADACYKTGISSLIGQSEGVLFVDFDLITNDGNQVAIITSSAGNEVNRLQIYIDSSRRVGVYRGDASVNILSSAYTLNSRIKAAVKYKLNDYAFYINGVLIGTDTSASIPPTPSVLYLGTYVDQVISNQIKINECVLFRTALTSTELIALTTI